MTEKKIVLVTGSSDGIGRLTAMELAKEGMNVLVHGRNAEKTNQVAGEIREATGNPEVEAFVADLSSMQGVRRLARLVSDRHDRLSILINNAGAGFADPRFNDEGMELRFAVNYLAPFLLTRLLLPLLKRAAPSRIINISSAGQQALDLNDLTGQQLTDPVNAYRRSKLALIMFTIDLAEELNGSGVTVNCLHPGTYLNTKMVRRAGINPHGEAEEGAEAEVFLATSPSVGTGKYFDGKNESTPLSQAFNPAVRRKLKELSERLIGEGSDKDGGK